MGIDAYDHYEQERIEQQAKRRANKVYSTEVLAESGLMVSSYNNGVHLVVLNTANDRCYDFWPSTGKYIERADRPIKGRGVHNLIQEMTRR